jgi:hypothetical protein
MVVLLPYADAVNLESIPSNYSSLSYQVIGMGCTAYSECDDYKNEPPEYADVLKNCGRSMRLF